MPTPAAMPYETDLQITARPFMTRFLFLVVLSNACLGALIGIAYLCGTDQQYESTELYRWQTPVILASIGVPVCLLLALLESGRWIEVAVQNDRLILTPRFRAVPESFALDDVLQARIAINRIRYALKLELSSGRRITIGSPPFPHADWDRLCDIVRSRDLST